MELMNSFLAPLMMLWTVRHLPGKMDFDFVKPTLTQFSSQIASNLEASIKDMQRQFTLNGPKATTTAFRFNFASIAS